MTSTSSARTFANLVTSSEPGVGVDLLLNLLSEAAAGRDVSSIVPNVVLVSRLNHARMLGVDDPMQAFRSNCPTALHAGRVLKGWCEPHYQEAHV